MRSLKIISLHFEHIVEHRLRSFVWFLTMAINPLMLLLFWSKTGGADLSNYYLLLLIAGAMFASHIEEDVAEYDIKQGELVRYLLKPISYYWIKLIEEIPYRILQGFYGIIVLIIIGLVFKLQLFSININNILIGLISAILAYFISYTYKLNLGLIAFWLKDIRGLAQFLEIIMIIFAGYILPLEMMPPSIAKIASILPFAYIIYFPVKILQGNLLLSTMLKTIINQLLWLLIFIITNRLIWKAGIKKFTAVGN